MAVNQDDVQLGAAHQGLEQEPCLPLAKTAPQPPGQEDHGLLVRPDGGRRGQRAFKQDDVFFRGAS